MSGADRVEDGFPHGTVEGFKAGCRNGGCPAGAEHGLSCKRAQMLRAGDYRYQRLVREGKTPWEIADALGLVPDTRDVPKRGKVPVADVIEEEDDVEVEGLDDQEGEEIVVEQVVVPTPKDVAPKVSKSSSLPEPTADDEKRRRAEIRSWAQEHGIPVGAKGRIAHTVVVGWLNDDPTLGGTHKPKKKRRARANPVVQAPALAEPTTEIVTFDADAAAAWPHPPTPEELEEFWEEDGAIGTVDDEAGFALLVVDEIAKTSELERQLAEAHTAIGVLLPKWAEAADRARHTQGLLFAQARAHSTEREAWMVERARMTRLLASYEYRIAELEAPDPVKPRGAHVAAPTLWGKRRWSA